MSYTLARVHEEHISDAWPLVHCWIDNALQYSMGEYTSEFIFEQLQQRLAQLWVLVDDDKPKGAVITSIEEYPTFRAVVVRAAAGVNFDSWISGGGHDELVRWSKEQGAHKIVVYGRVGWKKVLAPLDYKEVQRVYVKDLRGLH